ncbi:EAL domain-containing protein [Trichocoleus sp. FACHB-591]|uniref:EAL domain-containing protein n=1 Tax=Trichocoleus sp. FACHB-591 TaxID=2692872 RepID=UPI001685F262|nr:EAL domain-containing protein [Trichocoleus sp. FACHB-591]
MSPIDTSVLSNSFKLIIQPHNPEVKQCLHGLGFQNLPNIPQLLYLAVTDQQLIEVCLQIGQTVSDESQLLSRCFFTRSPLNSEGLLIEFLHAQPLSALTASIKYSWFFEVLINQTLFFKYQPVFNLSSGNVIAHECLARATGKNGAAFSGKQLVDAALSSRCVHEFDELARKTCLEAIANFNTEQTFFINVLPNAIIQNPQALAQNFQQVFDLGLRPQQIVFELTEVEALLDCPELSELVPWIREQGFGIAVDDLCGNVSFDHYFTGFYPDLIKLDRQLVHGCSQHALQQVLIKSFLHSAHELGILVLAEGLEDIADIEFCRELGVDFGQGYGLGMPELTLQEQPLNWSALDLPELLSGDRLAAQTTESRSWFNLSEAGSWEPKLIAPWERLEK